MRKIALFFVIALFSFSVEIEKALLISQLWSGGRVQEIQGVKYKGKKIGYVAKLSSGFVLIPDSTYLSPVKLYSLKNEFNPENPIIRDVIEELYMYEKALGKKPYLKGILDPKSGVLAWRRIEEGETETNEASPLLKTKWDQGYPYNYYAPEVNGVRTLAGCVAIAFAQIMKYWNWPKTGEGSHSYDWGGEILSADFNHTYYWERMPSQVNSYSPFLQIDAVSRLIYDLGVAFNMSFGLDGSGAYPSDAARILPGYFFYSSGISYKARRNFASGEEWFLRMKWERDLRRPFEFTICGTKSQSEENENVCHAAVVDGYRIRSGVNSVHINFGWSGYFDGYYTPDNIVAGGYSFTKTDSQEGIFDIFPKDMLYPPDGLKVIRHIDRGIFVSSYVDEIKLSRSPSSNISSYRIYMKKEGILKKIWEGKYKSVIKVRTFDEGISYAATAIDINGRESPLSPFVKPESQ